MGCINSKPESLGPPVSIAVHTKESRSTAIDQGSPALGLQGAAASGTISGLRSTSEELKPVASSSDHGGGKGALDVQAGEAADNCGPTDGGSYQIVAQAMDGSLFQPFSSSWGKTNSSRLMAAASGSVHQSSLRTNQTATPSRQSSSGSMTPSMFAFQPVEFGLGDVQPVQGSNSSIEVMVLSGGQPLTALLPTGFTPGTAVFDQALLSLPSDWVPLCRDRGLRSLMCLPLLASNGAGACVGALSMGCTEPMDWQSQWWTPSLQLITGWAASALTQTRAMQRAAFFEALSTAPDLDSLAATVVHALPALFQDVSMPKIEARLALVSSRLSHAIMYATPLQSDSDSLPVRMRQASGSMHGISGALPLGVSNGVLVVGQPYEATSMISMEGLVLPGPLDSTDPLETVTAAPSKQATRTTGMTSRASISQPLAAAGAGQVSGSTPSDSGVGSGHISAGLTFPLLPTHAAVAAAVAARRPGSCSSSGRLVGAAAAGLASSGGLESSTSSPAMARLPVAVERITTESTLLMSVLEAGDIMTIKDALAYFGRDRMVARDLALPGRPVTAGTLVLLPLVHRCRALGCVYILARTDVNSALPRSMWSDISEVMSRAVFTKLVGSLRCEWTTTLSEDDAVGATPHSPWQQQQQPPSLRGDASRPNSSGMTGWAVGAITSGTFMHPASVSAHRPLSASNGTQSLVSTTDMGDSERPGSAATDPPVLAGMGITPPGSAPPSGPSGTTSFSGQAPAQSHIAQQSLASLGKALAGASARRRTGGQHGSVQGATSDSSSTPPFTVSSTAGCSIIPDLKPSTSSVHLSGAAIGGPVMQKVGSFCHLSGASSGLFAGVDDLVSADSSVPGAAAAAQLGGGKGEAQGAISSNPISQELHGWPELIDVTGDIRRTRHMTLYAGMFKGQQVAVKLMRTPPLADGRGAAGPADPDQHCALLMRLTNISHPNLVNVLMVYSNVYEVVKPSSKPEPHHLSCLHPHHSSSCVFLTGIQPRREKYRQGVAVVMEYVPSISLREALVRRMTMLPASGAAAASHNIPAAAAAVVAAGNTSNSFATADSLTEVGNNSGYGTGLSGDNPPVSTPSLSPSSVLVLAQGSSTSGLSVPASAAPTIATAGPFDMVPNMALLRNILMQVAAGVQQLHSAGLIHGELRPENILVSKVAHRPALSGCGNISSSPLALGSGNTSARTTNTHAILSTGLSSPTTTIATPPCILASTGGPPAGEITASGHSIGPSTAPPHAPALMLSGLSAASVRALALASDDPLPEDVCVKLKDSGMCTITISKGQLLVRKLVNRPRTGLVPFLAPEIFRGERPTKACDAYSFGLLMWELYTGVPAFSNFSSTPTKLVQTVISDGLRPLFPDSTPAWYSTLATRCWHPNPKLRPSFRKITAALMDAASKVARAEVSLGPQPPAHSTPTLTAHTPQLPPIMSMPIREDPQDLGPRYPHGPLPPIPGSSSPQNGNRSLPLQLAGVLNAVVGDGGHGGGVGVGGAAGGAGSVRRA